MDAASLRPVVHWHWRLSLVRGRCFAPGPCTPNRRRRATHQTTLGLSDQFLEGAGPQGRCRRDEGTSRTQGPTFGHWFYNRPISDDMRTDVSLGVPNARMRATRRPFSFPLSIHEPSKVVNLMVRKYDFDKKKGSKYNTNIWQGPLGRAYAGSNTGKQCRGATQRVFNHLSIDVTGMMETVAVV